MQLAVCDVALSCLDVRPKNLRAALATDDEWPLRAVAAWGLPFETRGCWWPTALAPPWN